ncbi:hypothetical protein [Nostoc sp.]|uniref:hypothetical protein n=1 Tax=Nostoc sp. TaxID=1180 RepID=UPI002FF5DDD1
MSSSPLPWELRYTHKSQIVEKPKVLPHPNLGFACAILSDCLTCHFSKENLGLCKGSYPIELHLQVLLESLERSLSSSETQHEQGSSVGFRSSTQPTDVISI